MALIIPHEALTRIQLEYVEMPGLRLMPEQVSRLCGLPLAVCEDALDMLERCAFLQRGPNGSFSRRPRYCGFEYDAMPAYRRAG